MGLNLVDRLRNARNAFLWPDAVVINGAADVLNEAVNYDLNTIFVAVPKTGTTSVRLQIRPKGAPLFNQAHLDIRQLRDLFYPFELHRALTRNRTFPTLVTETEEDIRARSDRRFANMFKFSAVRNPWARAASLYFRHEGVKAKRSMSFEEFIRLHEYASDTCIHPTLHRHQADWLVDESGAIVMDYVYKLEELDQAIGVIREMTNGRLVLHSQHSNRNPASRSGRYRELYNDETRKLVATRFERDIDLFKYSF